jgi:NADPH oxidase 2
MVRSISCPVPGLSRVIPVIGDKTIPEILIACLIIIICLSLGVSRDSLSAGGVADKVGFIIIIFAIRNNFAMNFFGITFERYIFLHKVFAVSMIAIMLFHAIGEGYRDSGVAMAVLLGLAGVSYFTLAKINFAAFYFLHIICYIGFIPAAFIHGAKLFGASIAVWGVDLVIRYILMQRKVTARVSFAGKSVLKIEFDKIFSYYPGQYCFLMAKDVNLFEYHPFSIASASKNTSTVFYTKNIGDWTGKLHTLARRQLASNDQVEYNRMTIASASTSNDQADKEKQFVEMDFFVEGPYGSITVDFFDANQYKVSKNLYFLVIDS